MNTNLSPSMTPHTPTMKWVVVAIIVAFLVYHFGINRKK